MFRFSSILSVLIFGVSLGAQTPDTATVTGQVLDPTRAAVPGAEVKISNTRIGTERTARS